MKSLIKDKWMILWLSLFITTCILLCFPKAWAGFGYQIVGRNLVPSAGGGGYATIEWATTPTTTAYGSRANTSTSAPTGTTSGDVLIQVLEIESTTAVTVPSGAVLIGDVTGYSNGFVIYVAYQVVGGSPGYAWTHSTADTAAYCVRVTGVNTTTVLDTTAQEKTEDYNSVITFTGITTATAGAAVFIASSAYSDSVRISSSTLSSEIVDIATTGLTGELKASAGATGTETVTRNGDSNLAGVLFALRPASL